MTQEPDELVAQIRKGSGDTAALLYMLQVFCNLELRDVTFPVQLDSSLSDAAPGLAVLMSDLADRVEAIQNKVDQLYKLWPGPASGGAPEEGRRVACAGASQSLRRVLKGGPQ